MAKARTSNPAVLNNGDYDLGSGGVMLMPPPAGSGAPPLAVLMGKDPIIYALDQGLGVAPVKSSYRLGVPAQNGVWGGPAYFSAPSGTTIFFQTNADYLRAYAIAPDTLALSQIAVGTTLTGYGGSTPVVSSNGQDPGSAIVWTICRSAPQQLEAYRIGLGAPIFVATTSPQHGFQTPLVANGRVYVGGYQTGAPPSGWVWVFGLSK